jgi:hypothetical protein
MALIEMKYYKGYPTIFFFLSGDKKRVRSLLNVAASKVPHPHSVKI